MQGSFSFSAEWILSHHSWPNLSTFSVKLLSVRSLSVVTEYNEDWLKHGKRLYWLSKQVCQ